MTRGNQRDLAREKNAKKQQVRRRLVTEFMSDSPSSAAPCCCGIFYNLSACCRKPAKANVLMLLPLNSDERSAHPVASGPFVFSRVMLPSCHWHDACLILKRRDGAALAAKVAAKQAAAASGGQ